MRGWERLAACAGMNPSLFFPDDGDVFAAQDAKKVCAMCPVREPCLDDHIREKYGVWGGTTEKERARIRRQRRARQVGCVECGRRFEVPVGPGYPSLYCSPECHKGVRARRRNGGGVPRRGPRKVVPLASKANAAPHGTESKYRGGCRCDPCTDAHARGERERQRARRESA